MFEDRIYVVIPTTELSNINFDEVLETSPETCRYSLDGSQTFVKYEGSIPPSIELLANTIQSYSHADMLALLATEEWSSTE